MNAKVGRGWTVFSIAAALCCLATLGCDSGSSSYRPPTAAVNGGPSTSAASDLDTSAADTSASASVTAEDPPSPDDDAAPPAPENERKVDEKQKTTEPAARKTAPVHDKVPYFVGWPKPKLALVISGRQDGYLEPCGCAGLENQKGGLSRRHAFVKELSERGWPVAAVDVGGMVRRFGKQAELQFAMAADALKEMHYSAAGFGPADLRLSAGDIVASVAGSDPKDSIFVSANVNLLGLTPKSRIIKAGGMTVGVTSVLGDEYRQQVNNDEIEIQSAAEALKEVAPQLANCDVRVLLAHATVEESEALARQFPEFNLVVTADGGDEPPPQPAKIEGTSGRLVEVGHKGMYVVVAGFYDDPKQPVRYQRVALDSRYPDSAEMKNLMVVYQDQLQQLGWGDLGIKSVPHPRARKGDKLSGKFVGSAACKECHESAWEVWSNSKHAHATDTLAKLDPPRQFDAECISCHATGWNAQEFFPFTGGYESLDKTPHLAANGCENCHGPGAAHVAAEQGKDEAQRDAARALLHLTWEEAKADTCLKCHDGDNSPEFGANTERYWEEIAH